MSKINFNGCQNMNDVVRLHGDVLPGKVLLEFPGINQPSTVRSMPLLGVGLEGSQAVFSTEDQDYKKLKFAFPLGLIVVTSVNEAGDIFWSETENDWSHYYGIDDLTEEDMDVDSVLRFAADLPRTNLLLE